MENNVQHFSHQAGERKENVTEVNKETALRDKVGKGIKKKKERKKSHRTSHYGRAQDR